MPVITVLCPGLRAFPDVALNNSTTINLGFLMEQELAAAGASVAEFNLPVGEFLVMAVAVDSTARANVATIQALELAERTPEVLQKLAAAVGKAMDHLSLRYKPLGLANTNIVFVSTQNPAAGFYESGH